MKKYILLALILLSPLAMFSQGAYIADALWHTLKASKNENTPVRIVMVMRDHVDVQALIDGFDQQKTPLAARQHLVLRLLLQKATESQREVMQYLDDYKKQHKGTVNNIVSFWIANMIVAEVPQKLVWNLAERTDLESIDLDNAYMVSPVKPVSEKPSGKLSLGGSETGLNVIKANEMWRKGYTGRNRISYSIDTGVWPNHPAIKDRFLANFFPMSQCWFPYDLPLPGDKTGSHGTHTLGITLGLEAATSDTIGCAFNAYWMCSDPIVTVLADVKPLTEIIHAFEFALDPDGDTSTVWDIPDAINNSWGRQADTDTLLCNSYASQMFLAVEAAGIANVFSAGNNGPAPMTLGSPQDISTNIVNLFTVGALDGNTVGYPIASFSSRGPTICPVTGSLLIKPEVSAPGVNVRSSVGSNGYAVYSGTSMAGPHVTGSVLLLKEAFPFLPGSEILKALYFSATDLGDPGEDNTYGMGLIDLSSAFNYLSHFYTPVPPDSNHYDAEIAAITVPGGPYYCDSTVSPVIQLHNNADSTIHSGNIKFRTMDGTENNFTWTGNLTGGQSQNITLSSIPLLTGGSKEFSVWFQSDTAMHETSIINNHRMARFNFRPKLGLPFIEDFEQGINTQRWCINNPDQNITWDTMPAGGLAGSTYSAVMKFSLSVPVNQMDELVTPSFDFTGLDSVKLRFDVAYQNRVPALADSLIIYLSTDCGETFSNIIYYKGGVNLQTYDTATVNFVPWKASQWRAEYIDLSAFAGNPDVLIKFTGHNKRGNNLFLDNIKVYNGTEPASVKDPDEEHWKVWPNPATDRINVQFDQANQQSRILKIINIIGTTVAEKIVPPGTSGIISMDVSDLAPGIYILSDGGEDRGLRARFVKR